MGYKITLDSCSLQYTPPPHHKPLRFLSKSKKNRKGDIKTIGHASLTTLGTRLFEKNIIKSFAMLICAIILLISNGYILYIILILILDIGW